MSTIPQVVLDTVHLRLCRRVAIAIVTALAESGMQTSDVDAIIPAPEGYTRDLIDALIQGETAALRPLSDVMWAMGFEIAVSIGESRVSVPAGGPAS